MTQPTPPTTMDAGSAMAALRGEVAVRLRSMNGMHATHARDTYGRKDELAPYAVAFFWAEAFELPDQASPDGSRTVYELRTGTRLLLSGPMAADPVTVLAELTRVASRSGPDPWARMIDRGDKRSRRAEPIGVGLSSLDVPGRRWVDRAHRADGPLDVPGRAFALLADLSAILVERPSPTDRARTVRIRSSRVMTSMSLWLADSSLPAWHHPTDGPVWTALYHLLGQGVNPR
jgi:hypothetical protein